MYEFSLILNISRIIVMESSVIIKKMSQMADKLLDWVDDNLKKETLIDTQEDNKNLNTMLKPAEKSKIIKKLNAHEKDTGSPEVQIGLLTEEIEKLVLHLKKHPKDFHSKRGLIKMVVKRKKLLNYLKKVSEKRYNEITKKIG